MGEQPGAGMKTHNGVSELFAVKKPFNKSAQSASK
jgi:hypothetical protein